MQRYWIIAPVESQPRELFDDVWKFDLANNVISIGWHELGDVSKLNRDELKKAVGLTFPERPPGTRGLYANMIWAFYHKVGAGDFVVARRGRRTLAAVGSVTSSAFYAPAKNPATDHSNFLAVSWLEEPRNKLFPGVVFPMQTLAEISEVEFRNFYQRPDKQSALQAVEPKVEDPNAFALERHLEDFIVSNFDTIFNGTLKIYQDMEGDGGQQYGTDIGPIDILAFEPTSKSFVVIELKKGRPSDQVVGQVLRYMGWVKRNLCADGQGVKGLVICREPDIKLTYALEMANNIEVRYYNVSFKLCDAP